MELAPLCVPVEIAVRNGALRCFRLALAVSDTGLRLRSPLPDELLREPLRIRLTLPPPTEELARLFADEWDGNLIVFARAAAEVVAPNTPNESGDCWCLKSPIRRCAKKSSAMSICEPTRRSA